MLSEPLPLTIAIPTFCREQVLLDTVGMLLSQEPRAREILVLDQTPQHEFATQSQLESWNSAGLIRWIRLSEPSQPGALNVALTCATSEFVLFLDDDIRIEPGFLRAHTSGFRSEEIWAVAGQVLQPGESPDHDYHHEPDQGAFADCGFCFRSASPAMIENGMSGNLSVRRARALQLGGFDENFLPPVAYRFDNDFCKRLCRLGGQIAYEPSARIYHLRAPRGGTRSNSNHMTSSSPEHGVGDYYFAMVNSSGTALWKYVLHRFFREVRTKFHLRHPWYIPVKLLGEFRAILCAARLSATGPKLIRQPIQTSTNSKINDGGLTVGDASSGSARQASCVSDPIPFSLLAARVSPLRVAFVTSHPIQYQVPVFRHLAQRADIEFIVLFAMLPDAASQGAGFGVAFEWDIPLLEGYRYRVLNNISAAPGVTRFSGCDTPDVRSVLRELKIDVVVVNGWVVKTCLQTLWACKRLGIPCIVRGEANNLRKRPWWKRILQRQLVRRYDAFLAIGRANRDFYKSHGIPDSRMFSAPYCVENDRFARAAAATESHRSELRTQWNVPQDAVCFLYCGKFEHKKHPVELVEAFFQAQTALQRNASNPPPIHLLMVGDGELREYCQQLASRHSLLASITFTGFLNQTEIVNAYVAADVLVVPSDAGETWGLVVNEAMACGIPALVSDLVGCASDLIVPGKTGWTFKMGDWGELSMRLSEIGEDYAAISNMKRECQTHVQGYAPEIAAEGIVRAAFSLRRTLLQGAANE
jgi:glycosyltransferase involved in cell wall biosynthesis/GT2 family glycosyltransferase